MGRKSELRYPWLTLEQLCFFSPSIKINAACSGKLFFFTSASIEFPSNLLTRSDETAKEFNLMNCLDLREIFAKSQINY